MPDNDVAGWLPQVVAGLGLSSTAMGMWIIKTTGRQARLETKLDCMEKKNEADHKVLKDGLAKIVHHLTGMDL